MKIRFFNGSFSGKYPISVGLGITAGNRVNWFDYATVCGVVVSFGLLFFTLRIGVGRFEV